MIDSGGKIGISSNENVTVPKLLFRRPQLLDAARVSNDKISAHDPMGPDDLTSYKWLGNGHGHDRI